MKLLLDECVPRRLKRDFPEHDISTVNEAGFLGLKNGSLLSAAATSGFEILITVDKNIKYQQNPAGLEIAILILSAFTNRYESLAPLVPEVLTVINDMTTGKIVIVGEQRV